MELATMGLRQRDGVSCGPAVAVMAGVLLDADYRARLTSAVAGGPAWFHWEQGRVHAAANRIWPRALGTTPAGMARVIGVHGARYGWHLLAGPSRRRRDTLAEVERAVQANWPVAMLVGRVIPRHWVLVVDVTGQTWHCYEPSSGEVRSVARSAVEDARLTGLGFARPFAVVLPRGPWG